MKNISLEELVSFENVLTPDEIENLDFPKKGRKRKGPFADIRIGRYNNLQCRSTNLFLSVCVLEMAGKTMQRKIKREQRPWFFVSSKFWRQYDIPEKSWYRMLKILEESEIIEVRRGAGPHGWNLYAFVDQLMEAE